MSNTYANLINLLEIHGILYRLIEHPPEGRPELVGQIAQESNLPNVWETRPSATSMYSLRT
jgi:hypothetical protein